jgi:hypothetical protein
LLSKPFNQVELGLLAQFDQPVPQDRPLDGHMQCPEVPGPSQTPPFIRQLPHTISIRPGQFSHPRQHRVHTRPSKFPQEGQQPMPNRIPWDRNIRIARILTPGGPDPLQPMSDVVPPHSQQWPHQTHPGIRRGRRPPAHPSQPQPTRTPQQSKQEKLDLIIGLVCQGDGRKPPFPRHLRKEGMAPPPRPHLETFAAVPVAQVQPGTHTFKPQFTRQLPRKRQVRIGFLSAQTMIHVSHHVGRPIPRRLPRQCLQQSH